MRRAIAGTLLASMPGASSASSAELGTAERAFIDETEGLLLVDMMAVTELGRAEGVELSRVRDAVRRYKVGVTDDPWRKLDREKIRRGDALIRARVRGQDHAVTHMLDIVKRAITGVGAGRHEVLTRLHRVLGVEVPGSYAPRLPVCWHGIVQRLDKPATDR